MWLYKRHILVIDGEREKKNAKNNNEQRREMKRNYEHVDRR